MKFIPPRIELVDWVVETVAEAVGPHSRLRHLEPVGLQEHPQGGVVVAGVEVLQARVGVVAFSDPALGFGGGVAGQKPLGLLAEGAVDGAFDLGSGGVGDGPHRAEVVDVEPGRDPVGQFDRGLGVGQHLLGPEPAPHLDRAGGGGHGGGGRKGGAEGDGGGALGSSSGAGRGGVHAGQSFGAHEIKGLVVDVRGMLRV